MDMDVATQDSRAWRIWMLRRDLAMGGRWKDLTLQLPGFYSNTMMLVLGSATCGAHHLNVLDFLSDALQYKNPDTGTQTHKRRSMLEGSNITVARPSRTR